MKYALLFLLSLVSCFGAPIVYNISVDTSSINGVVGSFEMNWGGFATSAASNATLSGFTTDGTAGSEIADANNTGDLPGTVTFQFDPISGTATTAHNFVFGDTFEFDLTFDPALSNVDPNSFILNFYDDMFSELLVGSGFGPLLTISSTNGMADFFIGGDPQGPVTVTEVNPIPEPSTYALIAGGLLVGALMRRRK
jgi:hypothetical protein